MRRLAQAIDQIGYDHIHMFDHVVMGYPIAGRPPGPDPPQMPILEALMALSYMAAVTSRVTLGTEVLVLPQRHQTLVAKQVSTLDTLSGGLVRLGVGVGCGCSTGRSLGLTPLMILVPARSCTVDRSSLAAKNHVTFWSNSIVTYRDRYSRVRCRPQNCGRSAA